MAASDEPTSAPASEVRQVTILKCDLVGSTQMKSKLDLEGQADFEQRFAQIVAPIARRFEARIERFEGDGAFLVFGLASAWEDAAETALRAAHCLVEEVQRARLNVRVGVASGEIASLTNSPLQSVAGLTIDRAERLRAAAAPNQTILCEHTRALASRHFEYEDLGRVPAKGFEGGLRAWGLGAERLVSRFEAQRAVRPIVGRDELVARLSEHWTRSRCGEPQAVWLAGDAGVGKSRLAHEATTLAKAADAVILTLDCAPSAVNSPLFPVGVLLRRSAGLHAGMSGAEATAALRTRVQPLLPAEELDAALGCLSRLLELQTDALPALSPAELQEKTTSVLLRIASGQIGDRPGLLLCEDLHWADDSTLQLIARLSSGLAGRSVMVLATSRGPPRAPVSDLPGLTSIAVPPLDETASEELVRALASGEDLHAAAVDAIVARCEGVPLLIEELTRGALELPGAEPNSASRSTGGGVPVPLQLVVESRLAQNPDLAGIAKAASILGREVHVPLLAALTGAGLGALQQLGRAGLFDAYGAGERARFRHAMICDAVYATVMPTQRMTLHSRIADALLGDFASAADATPDVLAEHLRKAERFREAIEVRLRAAVDTTGRGAYVESEGHCRAALELVGDLAEPADAKRLSRGLYTQLGIALTGRLGFADLASVEALRAARALCDDDAELYPTLRGDVTAQMVSGKPVYELSLQLLDIARRSGDVAYVVDAMSVLCYATFEVRYAECRRWIEACLELYEANDGDNLVFPAPLNAAGSALSLYPTLLWMVGEPDAAERACCRIGELIPRLRSDFDRASLELWLAGFRITQKRWRDALDHMRTANEYAKHFSHWTHIAAISMAVVEAHLSADVADVDRAIAALDAFMARGFTASVPHHYAQIASACIGAGDPARAKHMVECGLAMAERCREPRMVAELMVLQAQLEPEEGTAIALLQRAVELADRQGSVAIALRSAAFLALRRRLPLADYAMATLDLLEGRAQGPPDWMRQRLSVLCEAILERPAA